MARPLFDAGDGSPGVRIEDRFRARGCADMGPTNVALVKLFEADKTLRDAKDRLAAITRDVRAQEKKVNELQARHDAASKKVKETQTQYGLLEIDMKSRDARIEQLRQRQQQARNNKEYQSLLIEISTQKVDRTKVEEQALKVLEQLDKAKKEADVLQNQLGGENTKLDEMRASINDKAAAAQAEVDALTPARTEAAAKVPPSALQMFERLADRFEGEAMAPITRPDARREEYFCGGCNMDLVIDVYNRVHNRDEMTFCPSCRRILYIPADLPVETAVKKQVSKTATRTRKPRATKASAAEGGAAGPAGNPNVYVSPWHQYIAKAQGESVSRAVAADSKPSEFVVFVDGVNVGDYKGQSADNLTRAINYFISEAGKNADVKVYAKGTEPGVGGSVEAAPEAAAPATEAEPAPSASDAPAPEPAT
jgi:predicted  nucleic acid-binding Zn-ribbon protein